MKRNEFALPDWMSMNKWVDLSHSLQVGMPSHPSHPKYECTLWKVPGDRARMERIVMDEHMGTHVDSMSHFVEDTDDPLCLDIDQMDLSLFRGHMVVLHIYEKTPGYRVTRADIEDWERKHFSIQARDIVAFDFGWDQKWGVGDAGKAFLEHWPGLAPDAVQYLLEKKVLAVGTDCVSMDASSSPLDDLPAHFNLLPKGVIIYEMLNHLEQLQDEALFLCIPLKLKDCTGSPVRPLALAL